MPTISMPPHIEGYIINFLTKNMWRVERSMSMEDAIQEGWVVYLRCFNKYPGIEGAHFMALFKTAWGNHFTDLTNKDTADRVVCKSIDENHTDDDKAPIDWDQVGDLDNDGVLAIMIKQAPREIAQALSLFINAPQEIVDCAMNAWRTNGRYRAGGDVHVARLLGLPDDSNIMQRVRDYFCQ